MSLTRRNLFIGLGSCVVLLGLGGLAFAGSAAQNRPPGGQDEDHLVSACIRCERCYEACPRDVIVPADIENGFLSMRTPTLSFENSYCDFCQEENGGNPRCVMVCPTQALNLASDATPSNTIIGKASIDTSTCLAYRDTGCRECYDHCPYEAISLTGDEARPRPVVETDKCNGCGACEASCVSMSSGSIMSYRTSRAITVTPITA
ncbi:MAG: 4Fe-4S dicluster domain-containing protein [Eggerthellaceae bacterium]|nr:4Fe-4S dicluster domain-containing protein [Eggerthellaceae bacterium]